MLALIARPILLVLLAAAVAVGSPVHVRSPYFVKDVHPVPRKWTRVGQAPSDHKINLQIGLKQSQFSELERHLYEVSDPAHQRYGQHLTQHEVNELVKPTDDALQLVHDWLSDHGIEASGLHYSAAKDWISVTLPVGAVESLLDTKYSVFEHEEGGQMVRAPEWSLPEHLHEHIEVIQPTNSFFRPTAMRSNLKANKNQGSRAPRSPISYPSNATLSQVCNETAVTPLCLRTLYGTVDYEVKAAGMNKIGLTNYDGESSNRSDVKLFLEQYRPEAAAAAFEFKVEVIANGGEPPANPDVGNPTNGNEPYLTWVQHVLSHPDPPQVISTSYDDDEQTVPFSYAVAVCNSFAQLGARGISLLFASGDDGVGLAGGCVSNDGKNTSTFLAQFPSTCPYITSVGATMNHSPEVVGRDPEVGFSSGGGFSSYFPRPYYQDLVVPPYIQSLNGSFDGLYDKAGRGYPDISAQGAHFMTTWNGSNLKVDGTSASTPAASAIIALINDGLIAAGRPLVGFLNPWLYANGFRGFTDVTSGSAVGCNTAGFPATMGWDAVSGWGTPYAPKIQALLNV